MGAVYKARQVSLKRLVALKTLQSSLAEDDEYIARFQQEAVAAAGLMHPNLVQVFSAGENDGLHWFAMEYVEGESAKVRLKRKGRIAPLEAIAIAIHVATALEYGWRKASLIHRDIKPDNIFLSQDGEVKLGDLGLAKSAGQSQGLTMTGHSMGSPHYISPEQVQDMKTVDLRADIYSLGCTLFHIISGKPPFDGSNWTAIMLKHITEPAPKLKGLWPECPQTLSDVVEKMMQKDPADRPQNYADVISGLRQAYDAVGSSESPALAPPSGAGAMAQTIGEKAPRVSSGAPLAVSSLDSSTTKVESHPPSPRRGAKLKANLFGCSLSLAVAFGVTIFAGYQFFFALKPPSQRQLIASEAPRMAAAPRPSLGVPAAMEPKAPTAFPEPPIASARAPQVAFDRRVMATKGKAWSNSPAPAPGAASEPRAASKALPFINSLGMKFVPVPGTKVLVSIRDTRVQDYATYATSNPNVDGSWKTQDSAGAPVGREMDHPVVGVNWNDAQAFCQWLTEKEQAEGKLPKGMKYRLPTDEEWIRAAGPPTELGSTPPEQHGKNTPGPIAPTVRSSKDGFRCVLELP